MGIISLLCNALWELGLGNGYKKMVTLPISISVSITPLSLTQQSCVFCQYL